MEERIKKVLIILKTEYTLLWIAVFGTVFMYEMDIMPQGFMVGDAKLEYMSQLIGVLLAICLIPMSLRMFSLFLTRYIKSLTVEKALSSYRIWSEIRILMLFVAAFFNISMYYWTMDVTGLLCGGMALIASMFCIPGRKRLESELDIYNESEEVHEQ